MCLYAPIDVFNYQIVAFGIRTCFIFLNVLILTFLCLGRAPKAPNPVPASDHINFGGA